MKGVFEFALNDGHTCRLEAEYECVMERDVLDADGYKIELEEKPSDSGKMTAFVDGKKVDDCRNTNSWGLIKIPKGKKIDGLRIGFASEETAQQYEKWISELIENGTSEEVKEYRAREEESRLCEEGKPGMIYIMKVDLALCHSMSAKKNMKLPKLY